MYFPTLRLQHAPWMSRAIRGWEVKVINNRISCSCLDLEYLVEFLLSLKVCIVNFQNILLLLSAHSPHFVFIQHSSPS